MEYLENTINAIAGVLWGPFMLTLLIGGGLFLTSRIKFIQFRHFGYIWKQTFGALLKKGKGDSKKKGTITPFQAVTTELGSTVGASNIIGCYGGHMFRRARRFVLDVGRGFCGYGDQVLGNCPQHHLSRGG
ncbi:hypothetical protein ES703_72596 [subsurface metagenome]